jgi:hypothetical protein
MFRPYRAIIKPYYKNRFSHFQYILESQIVYIDGTVVTMLCASIYIDNTVVTMLCACIYINLKTDFKIEFCLFNTLRTGDANLRF